MVLQLLYATCCPDARNAILWLTPADRGSLAQREGPEKEGWAMQTGAVEEAWFPFFTNIAFCPFCGARLPDRS